MGALSNFLAGLRDTLWRCLPPPPRDFDVSALLKPPWIVKPEWPGNSMGWRMGGEQYFFAVRKMYGELSPPEQAAYDRAYPEPPDWQGYFKHDCRGSRLRRP